MADSQEEWRLKIIKLVGRKLNVGEVAELFNVIDERPSGSAGNNDEARAIRCERPSWQ